MFAPSGLNLSLEDGKTRLPDPVLSEEMRFYQHYASSLNLYPTVEEAIHRLHDELGRLMIVPSGWQTGEVLTNIFLLACGILNCLDEHLRGPTLRLPGGLARTRFGRSSARLAERMSGGMSWRNRSSVRRWRQDCSSSLDGLLAALVAGEPFDPLSLAEPANRLATVLDSVLPRGLRAKRLGIPSPFSRLDLTPKDVLTLGHAFVARFPDRLEPILLIGLRTSGSYFGPLLKAFLIAEGYGTVSSLTIEPNKGLSASERNSIEGFATRGYSALIVDDPPHTAGTIMVAVELARRAGFASDKVKVLAPTHPARRKWSEFFPQNVVVSIEPEQWHKRALLNPRAIEKRLLEYFRSSGASSVLVVASGPPEQFDSRLRNAVSDERSARLKRVFEVRLETARGRPETRYILAKSVGCGWLGYQAFLAGQALSGFVPPLVSLRDGILFMEWIPQASIEDGSVHHREELIDTSASYVAARVRGLSLDPESISGMDLQRHNNGVRLLEKALSRGYGQFLTDTLMRSRIGRSLRERPCPCPTLIDGNMQQAEWIAGPRGPLKIDYEHHGMGKAALNVTDPAYDLAETILSLSLSPAEESRLIRRYSHESGDPGVERRLFMNKLLAGLWTMNQAQEQLLGKPRGARAQQDLHRRFMRAWDFLTAETALYCGGLMQPPAELRWRSPLVFTDIDGVLDRRLFGFPSTTAAGIEALSLLHSHGVSVAVNTARSVDEVEDYCRAYSLAGGVAEHGSYAWDAVRQRGQVLIGSEAIGQLEELKTKLRHLPGVFLDERHRYSIRAFTYRGSPRGLLESMLKSRHSSEVGDGALAPLPTLTVQRLLVDLGLDRLCFQDTMIDTTITAKEVNKGTGLCALRDWVLGPDAETVAIGDQEPDLTMFRAATRSFAPGNIGCAQQARLLGCRIVPHAHQRGLLEIARILTGSDGRRRERRIEDEKSASPSPDLFLAVLRAADRGWGKNLVSAVFDPSAFKIFIR